HHNGVEINLFQGFFRWIWTAPTFAGSQDLAGLPQRGGAPAEFVRRRRVEFEHLIMTGDDHTRADVVGQPGRLRAVEVAGHASFRPVAVDRQERDVDRPTLQSLLHPRIKHGIARVVEPPWAGFDNVTEETVTPGVIPF